MWLSLFWIGFYFPCKKKKKPTISFTDLIRGIEDTFPIAYPFLLGLLPGHKNCHQFLDSSSRCSTLCTSFFSLVLTKQNALILRLMLNSTLMKCLHLCHISILLNLGRIIKLGHLTSNM